MRWSGLSRGNRQRIEALQQQWDPVDLLETIRLLWRQSEPAKRGDWDVPKRTYRTRVDPLLTGQQAMQRLEQEHPGLYLGSLRTFQRRMGEWRVTHAEQVVGQQMRAIRDQENSQLNSKKSLRISRQLDG